MQLEANKFETYKHGTVRRYVSESVIHMVNATIVHHTRRGAVIDLVIWKIGGVREHDIGRASSLPPSR